jgi:hypothetical protein
MFEPARTMSAVPFHAAPTELGGGCGRCNYKHGAPSGAFCIAVAAPTTCKRSVCGAGTQREGDGVRAQRQQGGDLD